MKLPILKSVPEMLAKEQEFIQWGINNMKFIITYTTDMATLEQEKIDFDSMPHEKKERADEESIRLFGKDNDERYEEFKSDILSRDIEKSNYREYDGTDTTLYAESSDCNMIDTISYSPTSIEDANEWAFNANRVIIVPCSSVEDLDDLWNKFRSTTRKQQRESDWKSIELFGINNETHYNYLRSKLLANNIDNIEIPTTIGPNDAVSTESFIEKKCRYLKTLNPNDDREYIDESIDELRQLELDYYNETVLNNCISDIYKKQDSSFNIETSFLPGNYLLYYSPEELSNLGISDTVNKWFKEYKLAFNDYFNDDFLKHQKERSNKVKSLMTELAFATNEDERIKIKAEVTMNGWNPELTINSSNIEKAYKRIGKLFNEVNGTSTFINLSSINEASSDDYRFDKIDKNKINHKSLYPVYIVLLDDATIYSGPIKRTTDGPFSHVALAFDSKLDRMYTYHFSSTNREGGLAVESISRYPEDNRLAVYSIFVRERDYRKLIDITNYYLDNRNSTSYSYGSFISILFNTPIDRGDFKLVCSQFVDKLLKFIDVDLTNKDTSLVNPNDFYRAGKTNKKIYELFDGPIRKYNGIRIDKSVNRLLTNKAKCIKEGYISDNDNGITIEPVYEIKEFPVQFDKDGNLLIKKKEKIDFDSEYAMSHKLLLGYEKNDNIEGMTYELAKLWYLNNRIENLIYKKTSTEKNKLYSTRAMILNDFKKYLDIIQSKDNTFNFAQYFDSTPFSDNVRKVNSSTLRYTVGYLKNLL